MTRGRAGSVRAIGHGERTNAERTNAERTNAGKQMSRNRCRETTVEKEK
jgi:hypothetical protein